MRWAIAMVVVGAAKLASADPTASISASGAPKPVAKAAARPTTPIGAAIAALDEAPRACHQPACDAAATTPDALFAPVDVRIPIGGIAVASMEGLWLRRGPTLRDKPIMLSPIVVGGALTLSLGGSF
jgi:hypothetical protein